MIKLGIVGMSEGNGHPYSWSAIFNGYNSAYMNDCPFPVIPQYLSQQTFPQDSIGEGAVVAVYTQKKEISEHIAKAANIENVVESLDDMINMVDAVLIARDDAQTHYEFAEPIINAGLPVYIDKPLALSIDEAERIYDLEQYENQIFTCSALAYSNELKLSEADFHDIGQIKYIDACVPKFWQTYSIHIIEPVLNMIGYDREIVETRSLKSGNIDTLLVQFEDGVVVNFKTLGTAFSPISIRVYGEKAYKDLCFVDSTYDSFKAALQHFIDVVGKKKLVNPKGFVLKAVEIIEKGIHG